MAPVVVFIKGNPDSPQCGFSKKIVDLLNKFKGSVIQDYSHFDIFSDDEVREGLKKFSNWPTFPQLYVNGSFLGGLDVCLEMDEEGELEDELAKAN